jgi:Uma2 family endonuclease
MLLPEKKLYTIEDIYELPDGTRAELFDGQMYMMDLPNRQHQEIVGTLSRKIADYIDSKGGSCKTYIAPFAVFLNQDSLNYVEPDISVICDPKKLTDKGCAGAPDWVIEIVSPGSRRMDYSTKVFKYRSAGVREYWIVDPDKKRIIIWDFENDNNEEFSFSDSVTSVIYPELSIDFSQIEI